MPSNSQKSHRLVLVVVFLFLVGLFVVTVLYFSNRDELVVTHSSSGFRTPLSTPITGFVSTPLSVPVLQ